MIDQEEIHNQCLSDDPAERIRAIMQLNDNFSSLPDKQKAWDDLHKLLIDEDLIVRNYAFFYLRYLFSKLPNKKHVWEELHRMTNGEDHSTKKSAAEVIEFAFSYIPNKQQAWEDLCRLTNDENIDVRVAAVDALGSAFPHMPDKKKAWNELQKLTNDEYHAMRYSAAIAIASALSQVADKHDSWINLYIRKNDYDAIYAATQDLGYTFSFLHDKQQAWIDLHRLIIDDDRFVRDHAATALGNAFSHVPDKQQAWKDLKYLIYDQYFHVRAEAIEALGKAFSQVPDKQQAGEILHEFTNDEDSYVLYRVAIALGYAFPYVPDKQQAWNDIYRLTNAEDSHVRNGSFYSLGRASIFKASQKEEEDYKEELEKAIKYFEISTYDRSKFCLAFYRSFYNIVFKRQEDNEELKKYLEKAKISIAGSKNKEMLIEAVENLAKALKEVLNLENLDMYAIKGELNFYRKYCDRAAELINDTKEEAPYATEILRKGLPIIDRNLKRLLEEIQEKAKIACKESIGTVAEEIACAVSREVYKWEIDDQEEMTRKVEDIAYLLKMKVTDLSGNEYVLNKIESMRHQANLVKQYETLLFVIGLIPTMKVVSEQELDQKLDQKLEKFNLLYGEVVNIKDRLSCMSFNISNIGINFSNVISMLSTVKADVEKLNKISQQSIDYEVSYSILTDQLNDLNVILQGRLDELEKSISSLSQNDKTIEILNKLNEPKQAKFGDLIQTPASVATLIGFAIQIIQLCQQYKLI